MPRDARAWAALALAVLLIHLALIQPNHPGAATWGAFRLAPLELPVLLAALLLARGTWSRRLAAAIAALLAAMAAVKAADLASGIAFGRPFNPALDLHLAPAAWRLARGAVGAPLATMAGIAVVLALGAVAAALLWATRRVARIEPPARARPALAALLAASAGLAALDAAREASPLDPPGAAFTARLAWEHLRDVARARADLADFRAAAAADPLADAGPGLLAALAGRDVIVVFVESYGRAALEAPRYAPTLTATLDGIEAALAERGLAARSAWLASPVAGGQSWLAHATLRSGLAVDGQGRYRALLASPRRTLVDLAAAAGWRSVAVMPAITLAWPEAGRFGYARVMAAGDFGYGGPPFGWVTMPDQFALAAFERQELGPPVPPADQPAPPAPVYAEVALISSHAPFTPVPPILDWDALGDGAALAPYAAAGPAPEAVWSDPDRVRAQYALSLDYSLRALSGFAARRAGSGALLVVLGDHQPAGFVAMGVGRRDVPLHLLGPPELLERIDRWGFTPGMRPAPDAPVWPMQAFRDRFLAAFGAGERAREPGACPQALPAEPEC